MFERRRTLKPGENAGKGAGFRHQAERAAVAEERVGRTDERRRDACGGSAPTRSISERRRRSEPKRSPLIAMPVTRAGLAAQSIGG